MALMTNVFSHVQKDISLRISFVQAAQLTVNHVTTLIFVLNAHMDILLMQMVNVMINVNPDSLLILETHFLSALLAQIH